MRLRRCLGEVNPKKDLKNYQSGAMFRWVLRDVDLARSSGYPHTLICHGQFPDSTSGHHRTERA
jgi:hypothetical protein